MIQSSPILQVYYQQTDGISYNGQSPGIVDMIIKFISFTASWLLCSPGQDVLSLWFIVSFFKNLFIYFNWT